MSLSILAPVGPLAAALARAAGVADPRSARPLLGSVHLSTDAGALVIRSSGEAIGLTQRLDLGAAALLDSGEVVVDARRLATVVGGLSGDEVQIAIDGRVGKTALGVASAGARYRLQVGEAKDYPPPFGATAGDPVVETVIKGSDLARMLSETLFSISADENRYGLNGLLVETVRPDGSRASALAGAEGEPVVLRLATTDGSRLSTSQAPATAALALGEGRGSRLISRAFAAKLREIIGRDDGEWTIAVTGRTIAARAGNVELSGLLVDGEFPDYRQVLPARAKRIAVLGAAAWAEALGRAALMASDKNTTIRCSFAESALTIQAEDRLAGSVREDVPCKLDGSPLSTGFNARYMLDVLKSTKADQVQVELGEALDPCVIKVLGREDCWFVVMPMRID